MATDIKMDVETINKIIDVPNGQNNIVSNHIPSLKPKPSMRRVRQAKPKIVSFDDVGEQTAVISQSINPINGTGTGTDLSKTTAKQNNLTNRKNELFNVMGFSITKIHLFILILVICIAGYFILTWYNKKNELDDSLRKINEDEIEEEPYYRLTPQQYALYIKLMQNMEKDIEDRKMMNYKRNNLEQGLKEPQEHQETIVMNKVVQDVEPPIYVSNSLKTPVEERPMPVEQSSKSRVQIPELSNED